jgi:sodium-dependent dicarboxylate transporter 2/3/5
MAKAGLVLNLIGVIIITLATYYLGGMVFGIDLNQIPDWAVIH